MRPSKVSYVAPGSEDKDEKDVIVQIDAVQVEPVELTWPESDEEYTLVTVSHIESPHHFFVQFESSSDLIQDIGLFTDFIVFTLFN